MRQSPVKHMAPKDNKQTNKQTNKPRYMSRPCTPRPSGRHARLPTADSKGGIVQTRCHDNRFSITCGTWNRCTRSYTHCKRLRCIT